MNDQLHKFDQEDEEVAMLNGRAVMNALACLGTEVTENDLLKVFNASNGQSNRLVQQEIKRILDCGVSGGFIIRRANNYALPRLDDSYHVDSGCDEGSSSKGSSGKRSSGKRLRGKGTSGKGRVKDEFDVTGFIPEESESCGESPNPTAHSTTAGDFCVEPEAEGRGEPEAEGRGEPGAGGVDKCSTERDATEEAIKAFFRCSGCNVGKPPVPWPSPREGHSAAGTPVDCLPPPRTGTKRKATARDDHCP